MSFDAPQDPGGPALPQRPTDTPPSKDERMWTMFCHLGGLAKYSPVPFGGVIAPLIVWLIKKDEFPLVENQGKEALNFQISMSIYLLASLVLIFATIGFPLFIGLGIFDIVMIVKATLKANEGIAFHYPLCIRFIK